VLTYYSVLGVKTDATTEEIKSTYKQLAIRNHPDRGGSEEVMKMINLAAEILSDPKSRKEYDLSLSTDSSPKQDVRQNSNPSTASYAKENSGRVNYSSSQYATVNSSESKFAGFLSRFLIFWGWVRRRYIWIAAIIQVGACVLALVSSGDSSSANTTRIAAFAILVITICFFLYILNLEQNGKTGKKLLFPKILFGIFTIAPVLYLLIFSVMFIATIVMLVVLLAITFFVMSFIQ
jgi:hypothetical protein